MPNNISINEIQRRAGNLCKSISHISNSIFSYLNDHNYPIIGKDEYFDRGKYLYPYRPHYSIWLPVANLNGMFNISFDEQLHAYEYYPYLTEWEYVTGLDTTAQLYFNRLETEEQYIIWYTQNQVIGSANAVITQSLRSEDHINRVNENLTGMILDLQQYMFADVVASTMISREYTDEQILNLQTHIETELATSYLNEDQLIPIFQGVKDYTDDSIHSLAAITVDYVTSKVNDLNFNIDNLESYLVNMINHANNSIDEKLTTLNNLIDSNYTSLVTYVNNAFIPLHNKIANEVSNLTSYVNGLVNQTIDSFNIRLSDINVYIDDSINQTINTFNQEIISLNTYINENITSITNLLDGKVEGLYSYIDGKIVDTSLSLTSMINQVSDIIYQSIAMEVGTLTTNIQTVENNVNNRITEEVSTLSTSITSIEGTLTDRIVEFRSELLDGIAEARVYAYTTASDMIYYTMTALRENILNPMNEWLEKLDEWVETILETLADPALLFAWVTETNQEKWAQIRYLFQIILINSLAI